MLFHLKPWNNIWKFNNRRKVTVLPWVIAPTAKLSSIISRWLDTMIGYFSILILFWKIVLLWVKTDTAWKVSKYGVFSCPYFPAFGLNMERYSVSTRIQSKCGKIWNRKNSVFGRFHAVRLSKYTAWYERSQIHYQMFPKFTWNFFSGKEQVEISSQNLLPHLRNL